MGIFQILALIILVWSPSEPKVSPSRRIIWHIQGARLRALQQNHDFRIRRACKNHRKTRLPKGWLPEGLAFWAKHMPLLEPKRAHVLENRFPNGPRGVQPGQYQSGYTTPVGFAHMNSCTYINIRLIVGPSGDVRGKILCVGHDLCTSLSLSFSVQVL